MHPDSPWLQKPGWASGRIVYSTKKKMVYLAAAAVYWNVVTLPLWFVLPGHSEKDAEAFLGVLKGWALLVVGVGLAMWAVVAVLRWRKFGESILRMDSVPGVIGGQLKGVILTSAKIHPKIGFLLTLLCVRSVTTGSGKHSHTVKTTLWQKTQMAYELLDDVAEMSAIPVMFEIPGDCRPTDEVYACNETRWQLKVVGKERGGAGFDYKAEFEVPVFKAKTVAKVVADDDDESVVSADPERELREAGIRETVSPDGEGVRYIFPMARPLGAAIFLTFFWLFWTSGIVFAVWVGTPLFVLIVILSIFGLIDLVILYFVFDQWFYRSVADISPRGIVVKGGWLGLGTTRRIDVADIKRINCEQSVSFNVVYYTLVTVGRNGTGVTVGKYVPGERLAKAIIRQIKQAMTARAASFGGMAYVRKL